MKDLKQVVRQAPYDHLGAIKQLILDNKDLEEHLDWKALVLDIEGMVDDAIDDKRREEEDNGNSSIHH